MRRPEETLVEYMKAMNRWELGCAATHEACKRGDLSFKMAKLAAMNQYRPIYEAFLSQKHITPRDFHFSMPPSYDPENEKIMDVRIVEDQAEVFTQKDDDSDEYVYKLVCEDGNWRLTEKFYVAHDGSLLSANL